MCRHQGGTGGCRCILRLVDHPGVLYSRKSTGQPLAPRVPTARQLHTHHHTPMRHSERHRTAHSGWLRAAVLGANDGLISTSSLMVGVAAAGTGRADILVADVAGLVAGAMSMAAGR